MTPETTAAIISLCSVMTAITLGLMVMAYKQAQDSNAHERDIVEINDGNARHALDKYHEVIMALIALMSDDPTRLQAILTPPTKQDTTATGEHEVASEDTDQAPAVAAKRRNVIELLMRPNADMEETLPPGNEVTEEQLDVWEQSQTNQ